MHLFCCNGLRQLNFTRIWKGEHSLLSWPAAFRRLRLFHDSAEEKISMVSIFPPKACPQMVLHAWHWYEMPPLPFSSPCCSPTANTLCYSAQWHPYRDALNRPWPEFQISVFLGLSPVPYLRRGRRSTGPSANPPQGPAGRICLPKDLQEKKSEQQRVRRARTTFCYLNPY